MKYRWKTKPYAHQVVAVKEALRGLKKWGSFALLMAPRTGKTKTTIDVISIMHQAGHINRAVIVMPVSVMDVWIDEIKLHCPARWRITVWDKDGRKVVELPRFGEDRLDFVLLNYEAFSAPGSPLAQQYQNIKGVIRRSKSRGGRYDVMKKIKAWQPQIMVLDESHRIKSPSARKTTAIWSMAWNLRTNECLIPYRMILTGTVMTKRKRVFDIYSQWKFLNRRSKLLWWKNPETGRKEMMSLEEFKKLYAVFTERNGYPQWLRNKPQEIEKLRIKMHREAFAVTREECYDLPKELPPVIHEIPLTSSAKYYDQMAEEMVAMLETGEFTWAKIPLVQRLRLQQICSGIAKTEPTDAYPEGRLVRVGREKLDFLADYLFDQFEADEKVVIGAQFHGDIQGIQEVCKKLKVPSFELSGRVKRADRTSHITSFRRHDGAAAFIMQPAAGSLGIDLSTAATMIWYSYTQSFVDFSQANDRVALSPVAVRRVYLQAQNTIDQILHEVLMSDGDVAKAVTDSPQRLLRNFKNEKVARK